MGITKGQRLERRRRPRGVARNVDDEICKVPGRAGVRGRCNSIGRLFRPRGQRQRQQRNRCAAKCSDSCPRTKKIGAAQFSCGAPISYRLESYSVSGAAFGEAAAGAVTSGLTSVLATGSAIGADEPVDDESLPPLPGVLYVFIGRTVRPAMMSAI